MSDKQTTVSRFRWVEISKIHHELFWCGMYAGGVLQDYPHAETWRVWVSDCGDSSLVGVRATAEDAKQALMAKVWEISDAYK